MRRMPNLLLFEYWRHVLISLCRCYVQFSDLPYVGLLHLRLGLTEEEIWAYDQFLRNTQTFIRVTRYQVIIRGLCCYEPPLYERTARCLCHLAVCLTSVQADYCNCHYSIYNAPPPSATVGHKVRPYIRYAYVVLPYVNLIRSIWPLQPHILPSTQSFAAFLQSVYPPSAQGKNRFRPSCFFLCCSLNLESYTCRH